MNIQFGCMMLNHGANLSKQHIVNSLKLVTARRSCLKLQPQGLTVVCVRQVKLPHVHVLGECRHCVASCNIWNFEHIADKLIVDLCASSTGKAVPSLQVQVTRGACRLSACEYSNLSSQSLVCSYFTLNQVLQVQIAMQPLCLLHGQLL